jgi:hypothetical protein
MFASPGEMRVEARRHGVRVALPLVRWNESLEDIFKTKRPSPTPVDHRPLEIADRVSSASPGAKTEPAVSRSEPDAQEDLLSTHDLRPPSQPTTPLPSRSSRARPIISREERNRNGEREDSSSAPSNPSKDSFVSTRHTLIKFQLFS